MPRDPADAEPDLVKAIIASARPLSPETTDAQWRAIEVQAKAIYGGRKCYVRRPDAESPRRRTRSSSDMPT